MCFLAAISFHSYDAYNATDDDADDDVDDNVTLMVKPPVGRVRQWRDPGRASCVGRSISPGCGRSARGEPSSR